jgi:transglycosylase-like protein with SLT domain
MALPGAAPAAALAASVGPSALLEPAAQPAPAPEQATAAAESAVPPLPCLARTICSLKDRIRWGTPAWSPAFCNRIAQGVLASAKRNNVSPSLILAVAVNESDLDERAIHPSMKNGKLYARDSGLMGIRCVLDGRGYCKNGYVRGLAWKKLMDPLTNIELGARELARWRTGGVTRVTVRVRRGGHLEEKQKYVQCKHKTHAFWAHYNHGPRYIDHGFARHYPHRVAVLEYAIAQALNVDAPELKEVPRITIHDRGQRERTPDRPIEPRFRKLCSQIQEVGGQCSNVASLSDHTNVH